MLIAIIDFDVPAPDRAAALSHLVAEAPTVRKMKGNINFRAYADPLHATRVAVVHEWEQRADFDAYLASACFARWRELLRPIMTGAPISRRFEASLIESVK